MEVNLQMNLFDEIIEPEKKKIKTEKIGLFDNKIKMIKRKNKK